MLFYEDCYSKHPDFAAFRAPRMGGGEDEGGENEGGEDEGDDDSQRQARSTITYDIRLRNHM